MSGVGHAGGAGTIVNAMATGHGAAFGLAFHVEARVEPAKAWSVFDGDRRLPATRARLAQAAVREAQKGPRKEPRRITIRSDIPPECGLKSSSAVAVAAIRAELDLQGATWKDPEILKAAARAGLASGTSLTGAYDDAAACLLGGVVLTENRAFRLLQQAELPRDLEALVDVPTTRLATAAVKGTDFSGIRGLVEDAWAFARKRQFDRAMVLNTAAYAPTFGHDTRFTLDAYRHGAWAAGLSGKGPAQIALGDASTIRVLARRHPRARIVALRRRSRA